MGGSPNMYFRGLAGYAVVYLWDSMLGFKLISFSVDDTEVDSNARSNN